jgi:hypothetical protein
MRGTEHRIARGLLVKTYFAQCGFCTSRPTVFEADSVKIQTEFSPVTKPCAKLTTLNSHQQLSSLLTQPIASSWTAYTAAGTGLLYLTFKAAW